METIQEMMALFHKGGFVMYPLLLCSIFVGMIAIERFFYYRSMQTDMEVFTKNLMPKLSSDDLGGVMEVCKRTKGAIPEILCQTLCCAQCDRCNIQNILQESASITSAKLKKSLNWLDTVVTLAPLLGLLGTVLGMIGSFQIMGSQSGQPHAITGGVGEALIATATGLCVAMLALLVHSSFSHALDCIITDMEQIFNQTLTMIDRRKEHDIT